MTLHEIKDKDGRVFAFEIDNFFVGRRRVCRILRGIPGVRVLRAPRFLSWFREEEFCEFELDGERFIAWEPWGDSSVYWIGAEPPKSCKQIGLVCDAFRRNRWSPRPVIHNRYLPPWLHRLCNGLFGAAFFVGAGGCWWGEPAHSWLHVLSRVLLLLAIPVGIILAVVAHRFSIVEGVAGGEGYDELH